jgi:hypothetical protein
MQSRIGKMQRRVYSHVQERLLPAQQRLLNHLAANVYAGPSMIIMIKTIIMICFIIKKIIYKF